jgi:hypothetical protein
MNAYLHARLVLVRGHCMMRSLETTVPSAEEESIVPLKSDDTHDSMLWLSVLLSLLEP